MQVIQSLGLADNSPRKAEDEPFVRVAPPQAPSSQLGRLQQACEESCLAGNRTDWKNAKKLNVLYSKMLCENFKMPQGKCAGERCTLAGAHFIFIQVFNLICVPSLPPPSTPEKTSLSVLCKSELWVANGQNSA